MAILDELKSVRDAAFKAARNGNTPANPYTQESSLHAVWEEGRTEGAEQRKRDERYEQNCKVAADKRALFEMALTNLLGGENMRDEFEQWLAEFVDARTR